MRESTFSEAPDEQRFHVCNGASCGLIYELADAIEHMSDEEFHVHVTPEKNDFASWIEHVLHNTGLAHDLHFESNVEDRGHYVKTIRDHVAWLESA